jgi:hypothetical protein
VTQLFFFLQYAYTHIRTHTHTHTYTHIHTQGQHVKGENQTGIGQNSTMTLL